MKTYKYYFREKTNINEDSVGWYRRIYKTDTNGDIVAFFSLDETDCDYNKWYEYPWPKKDVRTISNSVLISEEEAFRLLL